MVNAPRENWDPGSFTKNYSWGRDASVGLLRLHEAIRLGFNGEMQDVPRDVFRARVSKTGRPDLVPVNFFLYNFVRGPVSYLLADELVFQALSFEHSSNFDKLAMFAFNFGHAGQWLGSRPGQDRPTPWSLAYVQSRVARHKWGTSLVSADDIESFLTSSPEYTGKTTRKVATNLSRLFELGRLREFSDTRVTRWWVDALFLALDRLLADAAKDHKTVPDSELSLLLSESEFSKASGQRSSAKDLAMKHLVRLFVACGGVDRFSEETVEERTNRLLPQDGFSRANDRRPQGAVHPSNPDIVKSIPRYCAMLARYAGFEVIGADELEHFDVEEFVRRHMNVAVGRLKARNIRPLISSQELLSATREK